MVDVPDWIRKKTKSALGDADYIGWDDVIKWIAGWEPLKEQDRLQQFVKITRETAARGQIESAILIWFLNGDVAAIHSLAVAARELLHNLGKKIGKPSGIESWLKTQPNSVVKLYRLPQNFFKHANKDPDASIKYLPVMGEVQLIDAISCYEILYDKSPPLMRMFKARFTLEYPPAMTTGYTSAHFLRGAKIDDIAHLSRSEFLVEAMLRFPKSKDSVPN